MTWTPLRRIVSSSTIIASTSIVLGNDHNVAVAIIGPLVNEIVYSFLGGAAEEVGKHVMKRFIKACEDYRNGDVEAIEKFIRELKELGLIAIRLPRGNEKKLLKDKGVFKPEKPKIFSSVAEAAEWGEQAIKPESSKFTPLVKFEENEIVGGKVQIKKINRYLPSDMEAEIKKQQERAA